MRGFTIGILTAVLMTGVTAQAAQRSGYIRKDGVYVPPSYSSTPNGTTLDNYSTRGNVNPYTGRAGTVNPYPTPTYSTQSKRKSGTSPY